MSERQGGCLMYWYVQVCSRGGGVVNNNNINTQITMVKEHSPFYKNI